MKKSAVIIALGQVARARSEWGVAQTSFTADVDILMKRLLNEAATHYMSAEEVARLTGMTVKRIRALMRENGLNPKNGKRLLAKTAAETLAENAALMGVEPAEFDLTSPLAYLPMGSQLKSLMETNVDLDESPVEKFDPFEPRPGEREAWRQYEADNYLGTNDIYAFMMGYRAAYDAAHQVGATA